VDSRREGHPQQKVRRDRAAVEPHAACQVASNKHVSCIGTWPNPQNWQTTFRGLLDIRSTMFNGIFARPAFSLAAQLVPGMLCNTSVVDFAQDLRGGGLPLQLPLRAALAVDHTPSTCHCRCLFSLGGLREQTFKQPPQAIEAGHCPRDLRDGGKHGGRWRVVAGDSARRHLQGHAHVDSLHGKSVG